MKLELADFLISLPHIISLIFTIVITIPIIIKIDDMNVAKILKYFYVYIIPFIVSIILFFIIPNEISGKNFRTHKIINLFVPLFYAVLSIFIISFVSKTLPNKEV